MKGNDRTPVILVGAGKIGAMIVDLLLSTDDYDITVIDASETRLAEIGQSPRVRRMTLDVTDESALAAEARGHFAMLSATPFFLTSRIARAARHAGVHYLDLTEDVASTAEVKRLAEGAAAAFIPQCGLAPGFISIVTSDIASRFEALDTIRMCVGALPQFPSNSLNYNLTWSTDGVINEYCEPCIAIKSGELTRVAALEHLEHFSLDGVTYESFNTSGGIGTLADTLRGRVKNLSYQTIRYPGHRDIMKTLLYDLGLRERRDLLKDVLEHAVPATLQDVVLIFVTVSGTKQGRLMQETYANKIYGTRIREQSRSAIQITTAAAICAVLDLLAGGKLPGRGFVTQEQIMLSEFLGNRFGHFYQASEAKNQAA